MERDERVLGRLRGGLEKERESREEVHDSNGLDEPLVVKYGTGSTALANP